MPRSSRQVPKLYFGQPGKTLQVLPWPKNGIEKAYERQTFDFLTGGGFHQISSLAGGSRPYNLSWDTLHIDTFSMLEQYRVGANGPGPWFLADPSAPNLLPPNVASATGLYGGSTYDWLLPTATAGQGVLSGNKLSQYIHRNNGWGSLQWKFATTPDSVALLVPLPQFRNWYGQPVVAGLPYTFSSWITVDGTVETNATVSLRLGWLDATGAQLSETAGSSTAITTWTRLSVVNATAPPGAVYCEPRWRLDGTTMAAGGSLFIDEPLWEQDSALNSWAVGTGIRAVEITGLTDQVPWDARFRSNGITLNLRELAK
jgi:hypothetical protein